MADSAAGPAVTGSGARRGSRAEELPAVRVGATMPREEAERRAALLKAVADPARLQVLGIVRGSPAGEACVRDLAEAVGLSQPTMSHHLRILVEAGLLTRERRGTWAWYTLVPERLAHVGTLLD
ncbi:helix-turn-helix transcriptional regulator [Phycicoccus sp. Soil748]|uniref:ArsR/SmtB family transcription factor n=1 Tax=Phycicoccus sp. Soil748 TaxID=1736397 RepID=UPI000AAB0B55|nr:metalloregulator ArsR/SmtB family transcription factor [Phycicoccus sp. Soil748]